MFVHFIIELFVVQAEAHSEQTQLYFLWFVPSKTYFHSWCIFMIHPLLLELHTNISVIDWFQKRSSEALVYLRSHWGKSSPVFIPALLLMLWFVLTLLCTSKIFFFFFQSIKDQKPCQSKADHLNFLPSSKSLNMRQNYLLNYTLWV